MSDGKQPKKKKPSEDDKSENSDEGPRYEQSPDDAEDKCLLSVQQTAGAEALPVASGSGASSSSAGTSLASLFRKISPFKSKESSKARKPPCKKMKKESSFVKAKNAFRKTFRRSDSAIQGADPDNADKRRRKYSDPTHSRSKIEPIDIERNLENDEPKSDSEHKSRINIFGLFSGSTSKEPKAKKEPKTKGKKKSKTKKEPEKEFAKPSASTSKATASPSAQKKALSPRSSYQPSIGAVSVGFFNEGLLPSESSGNPTESTSLDIKSGSSFSPDAPSGRRPTIKRQRTDEESSSD